MLTQRLMFAAVGIACVLATSVTEAGCRRCCRHVCCCVAQPSGSTGTGTKKRTNESDEDQPDFGGSGTPPKKDDAKPPKKDDAPPAPAPSLCKETEEKLHKLELEMVRLRTISEMSHVRPESGALVGALAGGVVTPLLTELQELVAAEFRQASEGVAARLRDRLQRSGGSVPEAPAPVRPTEPNISEMLQKISMQLESLERDSLKKSDLIDYLKANKDAVNAALK
jgi:hypothetical protein